MKNEKEHRGWFGENGSVRKLPPIAIILRGQKLKTKKLKPEILQRET